LKEPPELESPVSCLKGVGPAREKSLFSVGVRTIRDLFLHFPRRYEDRRRVLPLRDLVEGKNGLIVGVLDRVKSKKTRRRDGKGSLLIFTGLIREPGEVLHCTWFNCPGLSGRLRQGDRVALFGKVERDEAGWSMSNPECQVLEEDQRPETGILPLYPSASGLSQVFLRRMTKSLFELPETRSLLSEALPRSLMNNLDLIRWDQAIEWLHYPPDENSWKAARKRVAFEEFFALQVRLRKTRLDLTGNGKAPVIRPGAHTRLFLEKKLPFNLTETQRNSIEEIWADLERDVPMRRLLHGEVGSGKTVVALGAAMAAIDSGQKVAFMVPTEVLAIQHYRRVGPILGSMGVECLIVTGGEGRHEKSRNLATLENEDSALVFGTHALFQSKVCWRNLGLVIVDEQHRFGVTQKSAIVDKGFNPHLLVMSATPIPRTLTLTAYGELDVSRLDEPIPGRMPVRTFLLGKERLPKLLDRIKREIASGGQVLWVCPHLEENGSTETASVTARLGEIRRLVPGLPAGIVHGRMPSVLKEEAMTQFEKGEIRLLVATTVVEVGIDVPGATMVVIEDAERFGLSQLHQLRGRVGRGSREGICVLLSSPEGEEAFERLRLLTKTEDGFSVAEADLRLRGPGSLCGTRQHGVTNYRIADLVRDKALLETARLEAQKLQAGDPLLEVRTWFSSDDDYDGNQEPPLLG